MAIRLLDKRISQKKIGSAPKKVLMAATGGTVYTSGSYKVHVFTSTDSFRIIYTSSANLSFDCFLVAGGDAGDAGADAINRAGGNGGNGGSSYWSYLIGSSVNTYFNNNTNYTVTVGGGGSDSTLAYKSGTLVAILGPNWSINSGGGGGQGEHLQDDPNPPDPEGAPGYNGNTAVITSPSIDLGLGPYTHYCGSGGGGGGAGGNSGGQGGRQPITAGTSGDGGMGGNADTNDATAGNNGIVNSGDGGGGGGGGAASYSGAGYLGAAGGSGGSGIVFIKYLYQQ